MDDDCPWTDERLAAVQTSLRSSGHGFVDGSFGQDRFKWGKLDKVKVHWRRVSELSSTSTLFGDVIDPSSVRQGRIGDCFFIAALSLLCSKPDAIRRLFVTPDINPEGLYCIQFFKQGRWQRVVIDDYLPVRRVVTKGRTSYKFLLGRSTLANVFWVSLVEKAYAKLYGSYRAISGGNVSEALVDLTGTPVHDYSLDATDFKEKQFWAHLLDVCARDRLVGCAMCRPPSADDDDDDDDGQASSPSGIVANHAYSVHSVVRVRIDGKIRRLLQVKNPQGSSTFSGAFSSLTDDARRVLGDAATSQTGGGMFWMTWNEFRREFNRVYVCHWATALSACVQSSWTATTSGGCTDYASCRTNPIFVAAGGVVAIGLQQRDRRFGRPNEPITYPMIGVTILRMPTPPDNPFVITSPDDIVARTSFWNKRDVAIEVGRLEHPVLVMPSTHAPGVTGDFVLNVYTAAGSSASSSSGEPSSIQKRHTDLLSVSCDGEWSAGSGGGPSSATFASNPKFVLSLDPDQQRPPQEPVTVFIGLRQDSPANARAGIGVVVLRRAQYALEALQGPCAALDRTWFEGKTTFTNREEVSRVLTLSPASFPVVIVPCTWAPATSACAFTLTVYGRRPCRLRLQEHR
ncbi:Calpain catalytic domain-containing protein [Plasmodiophora brassicae]|uniref:Calpain catalytic domain-containing protein n=1 Tax=Plasmodiophora brassicae TaxID=37360 RepID=A0A3P3Y5Y1_PLABS|nr:unnamed protein product [Plasmodiophora brassicae]